MTREQEIQERLGDINARWIKSDLIREVLTSGERQALDDITYLLARVATLEAERDKALEDGNVDSNELHAAQSSNAQRDARLFKAGLEAAAKEASEWGGKTSTAPFIALAIRALATDDAAIQAAVDQER